MTLETTPDDAEIQRTVVELFRQVNFGEADPVAAGLVADVDVTDGIVTVRAGFEGLDLEAAERLAEQLRGGALAAPGVDHVRIESTTAEAPEVGAPITGVDTLLAVGSAKGGVGKTTITVSLARALAERGFAVGVFDANVHAPDAPDVLGADGPIRATAMGRPEPIDADGIEVVSVELIADDGPVAWRGAMVHDVLTDLLGNAEWTDRDVVLVDLPPGIGDAVVTIAQQAPLDGAIAVTTETAASVRATERTASLLSAYDVETVCLVANETRLVTASEEHGDARGSADARRGDPHALADELDCPVYEVPTDSTLRAPLECSFADRDSAGTAAIDDLADAVARYHAERDRPEIPDDAVDLRGLPPSTAEQQAVDEFGSPGSTPIDLVTRTEPSTLVDTVSAVLESDGLEPPETTVEDLGRHGFRCRIERPQPMRADRRRKVDASGPA